MAIEVAVQFRLHYLGLSSGKSWTMLAGKQMQPLTIRSSCGKSWPMVGLTKHYQGFQVLLLRITDIEMTFFTQAI